MRDLQFASFAALILFLMVAALFYLYLPDVMASHWNLAGEPDSYMSKGWFTAIFAGMTTGLWCLFYTIPKIDPLKKNIKKFVKYYDGFVLIFVAFMFWIYLASALFALGFPVNITLAIVPGVAVLIFYAGLLCTKSSRNWFIGFRTPWTLSSDKVWEKTNRLGGRLLELYAVLLVIGLVFSQSTSAYFILILIIPILVIAACTTAYSYFLYNQEHRKGKKR